MRLSFASALLGVSWGLLELAGVSWGLPGFPGASWSFLGGWLGGWHPGADPVGADFATMKFNRIGSAYTPHAGTV
jgi:hypothetical protein